MFDNLSVRNKFLAVAAVPVNVLVVVAVWAATVAEIPLMAVVAGIAAVVTVVVASRVGSSVGDRVAAVTAKTNDFDMEVGIEVAGDDAGDEVGDLDRALAELTRRTKDESDQQRNRANEQLSSIVRDFSIRNHSLIDGQLDHIDWLEATEEDPDRLEHLFELDHLANRMRRSGESIMVLAGVDTADQRTNPAPITDVLRVAMGCNTKYRDIGLQTVDEVLIEADSAWEATHLLSELLENATQFSPDNVPVEIHAIHLDDGSYRVTIIDHGSGMSNEQLNAAASILANPADLDLSAVKSIGLQVAGRLAARLSATVDLSQTAGSGVTVEILLPAKVIVSAADAPASVANGQTQRATSERSAPDQESHGRLGEWVAPTVQSSDVPLAGRSVEPAETLQEALGTGVDLDAEVGTLLETDDEAEPADLAAGPANEIPAALRGPADLDAISALRPAETDEDSALDDSAPGEGAPEGEGPAPEQVGRAAAEELGLTRRKRGSGSRIAGPDSRTPVRASTRKPDEVRTMISQYRDGLKGGRGPGADNRSSDDQVTAEPKT